MKTAHDTATYTYGNGWNQQTSVTVSLPCGTTRLETHARDKHQYGYRGVAPRNPYTQYAPDVVDAAVVSLTDDQPRLTFAEVDAAFRIARILSAKSRAEGDACYHGRDIQPYSWQEPQNAARHRQALQTDRAMFKAYRRELATIADDVRPRVVAIAEAMAYPTMYPVQESDRQDVYRAQCL